MTVYYKWPLRHVAGLVMERVDRGVDCTTNRSGQPVYALGTSHAVVWHPVANVPGPNGTKGSWATIRLIAGPLSKLKVKNLDGSTGIVTWFYEENPQLVPGFVDKVFTNAMEIGTLRPGQPGMEMGFGTPDGQWQLARAYGAVEGFASPLGVSASNLMVALGGKPGIIESKVEGSLPPGFPHTVDDWRNLVGPH